MLWNIVQKKFIEIKKKAIEAGVELWAYEPTETSCLAYWVSILQVEEYCKWVSLLRITEYRDFLLLRYGHSAELVRELDAENFDGIWDWNGGILRECRSVVLNIKTDELVLAPFRKFRNLNECEETSYEQVKCRIQEASCVEISNKLDGSLQSARYYNGEFVMAGSQALNLAYSWQLADGYRMLMQEDKYQKMLKEHPNHTFIFEYISKRDAHVVKYDVEGLFLIGIRDMTDGREASYQEVLDYASHYQILTTEVFDKTLEEVLSELDSKKSNEAEGFVVNIDGFRVKVKYNDYVLMHKIISKLSSENTVIQSIAENQFDDLLAKMPDAYREQALRTAKIVYCYTNRKNAEVEEAYQAACEAVPTKDRKQFMLWVTQNVSKDVQGFVRLRFLGKKYNVLKRGNAYLKLRDMECGNEQEETEDAK